MKKNRFFSFKINRMQLLNLYMDDVVLFLNQQIQGFDFLGITCKDKKEWLVSTISLLFH